MDCVSQLMSQSIPSITIPPPQQPWNPGTFDLNSSLRGQALLTQIALGGGRGAGFDKGWEVTKILHSGLIPIQNRLSVQSMKQGPTLLP